MNRRIQTGQVEGDSYISLNGQENSMMMYKETINFLRRQAKYPNRYPEFKIARRSFSGAQRLRFYAGFTPARSEVFIATPNIFLCKNITRKIFKLSKRTKKFSLWVKVTQ